MDWPYGTSTIWHSNDVQVAITMGIACSNDVHDGNSDHWHANDVGQHTKTIVIWVVPHGTYLVYKKIAVFPGNWEKNCGPRSGLCLDHR